MTSGGGTWSTRNWVAMVVLVLVSALMQFINVRESDLGRTIHGDGVKYVMYAYNLKHHATFSRVQSFPERDTPIQVTPDKLTLPGYPYFLSLFLGDGQPDAKFLARVQFAQAALGVVSTLLVFLIALRLLPLGWATAAGLLVATQPHLVAGNQFLLTENLFIPLFLGSLLATLQAAASTGRAWHAVVAGALLGFASLVRPQLQIVPWLLLVAVVLSPWMRARWKPILLGAIVFAAILVPWQLRNLGVERPAGEPDLLATSIYHGSFPGFMYEDDPRTLGYPHRFDPDSAKYSESLDASLSHVGGLFAVQPVRYTQWYLFGKPGMFLSWSMFDGAGDIWVYEVARSPWFERPSFLALRAFHLLLHWVLMAACIATVVVALWRPAVLAGSEEPRRAIVATALFIAVMIAMHMVGLAIPRYNLPFKGIEIAMALVGMHALWRRGWPGRWT